jgi:predicted MFS family arabinose efflux permease
MVTTVAVIIGVVTAGITLDLSWNEAQISALAHLSGETTTLAARIVQRFNIAALELGPLSVGLICFGVAVLGFLSAFGVKRTAKSDQPIPFPWRGPFDSVAAAVRTRKDPLLLIALFGSAFFYFASTLVLAILHELCIEELGFSHSQTSTSMGALAIGIAVGALISAKLSERFTWREMVPRAIFAFGVFIALIALVSRVPEGAKSAVLFILLLIAGATGGMVLIPVVTFIQVRPAADEKGRTIGIANFMDFTGIFIAGELFRRLNGILSPISQLVVTGAVALVIAAAFTMSFRRASSHD